MHVLRRVPRGTVDVVLSYCHNTLNDTTLADMLPYFQGKGVGVISASCTSMGMFTKQAWPCLLFLCTPHCNVISRPLKFYHKMRTVYSLGGVRMTGGCWREFGAEPGL
jgi:hypothetical protein